MSSTAPDTVSSVIVEDWEPLDPEEPVLHHLPFKIAHTGHAKVSQYMIIKPSKIKRPVKSESSAEHPISFGLEVKKAAFRGRYIKGTEVTLSPEYTGVIFREESADQTHGVSEMLKSSNGQNGDSEYSYLKDISNVRCWRVQNIFKKYTYWTRSPAPGANDKHAKWIEWTTEIGRSLHAPLCPADLAKPLQYGLNTTPIAPITVNEADLAAIDASLPEKKSQKRQAHEVGLAEPTVEKKPAHD